MPKPKEAEQRRISPLSVQELETLEKMNVVRREKGLSLITEKLFLRKIFDGYKKRSGIVYLAKHSKYLEGKDLRYRLILRFFLRRFRLVCWLP